MCETGSLGGCLSDWALGPTRIPRAPKADWTVIQMLPMNSMKKSLHIEMDGQ